MEDAFLGPASLMAGATFPRNEGVNMFSPSRPIAIAASSVGLALAPVAITACGGGGATAATSPAKTTSTSPTDIATAKTALGTILVDSQGRSLYLFTHDSGTTSMCSGACAAAWPPVVTVGTATATSGANAALLGTTKRADGTTQVTYNGHPLYRFVKDQGAGETNGQGLTAFGGSWFTVTVAGNQAGNHSSSRSASTAAPATPAPKAEPPAPKPAPEPAPPKPAHEPAPPKPAPAPKAEPPAEGGIPQNGGGDGDSDNNGGPSDGDGNV
jgi:predicted lipoprotein with Yx(FWY)xxD motif